MEAEGDGNHREAGNGIEPRHGCQTLEADDTNGRDAQECAVSGHMAGYPRWHPVGWEREKRREGVSAPPAAFFGFDEPRSQVREGDLRGHVEYATLMDDGWCVGHLCERESAEHGEEHGIAPAVDVATKAECGQPRGARQRSRRDAP